MDKIIYLEPDEEITSVLDRFKKVEEKSVVFVIPKGATLLQSLINLKLLAKKASEYKKEIALVTQDKIGRNLASIAGLSVYSDPKLKEKIKPQIPALPNAPSVVVKSYAPTTERAEEPSPSRLEEPPKLEEKKEVKRLKFPKPHISWFFWVLIALGVFTILGIIYLIIPKAKVTIFLKTEPYTQILEFSVDPKVSGVDLENKIIPGEPKEEIASDAKKWQATGSKNIGTKASGTITVSNSLKNTDGTGSEITLASGTEFKDKKSGKSFFSNSSVSVPRLTYDPNNGQSVPGTANVKVAASEAGASYNIGSSSFSVPSIGSSTVSGSTSESMAGGSDKLVTIVTDDDINKAREQISNDLTEKAKKTLSGKLSKDEKLLDEAVKKEITKSSSSKKAQDQASEFDVSVSIKIQTLIVSEKQYTELLSYYLNKNVPSDKVLVQNSSDTTDISLISYDFASSMKVKASLTTKLTSKIDQSRLKQEIAKKDMQDAKTYLEGLDEIESASIQIWSFSKKLPPADRILLKTNHE